MHKKRAVSRNDIWGREVGAEAEDWRLGSREGRGCLSVLNTGVAPGRAGRAGESFKPVVWEHAVIFRNQFC